MGSKNRKVKKVINRQFLVFCAILLVSGTLMVAVSDYFYGRQFDLPVPGEAGWSERKINQLSQRVNELESLIKSLREPQNGGEATTSVPDPETISEPGQAAVKSATEPAADLPAAKSAEKDKLNYDFGMSVGETMLWLDDRELTRQLDDLALLGVGRLRFDIDWSHTQPNDGENFKWEHIDRFVDSANERGFKLVAILGYTPKWALPTDCPQMTERCYPEKPEEFANFAAAAVKRYSGKGIKVWEIWNEPNLKGFWLPAADAKDYAALLKAASAAIKKVDPAAAIVTGGLGPAASKDGNIAPAEFLSELYDNGAGKYFDAVGHHPYSFPAAPTDYKTWSGWSQMAATAPSLRGVMAAYGDGAKRLLLTESGAPTGGPGKQAAAGQTNLNGADHVTEELQAKIFQQGIALARDYDWDGPLFFYGYKDLGTDTASNENFFGILRSDGTQKPVYETIRKLLAEN